MLQQIHEHAFFVSGRNALITPKLSQIPGASPTMGVADARFSSGKDYIPWGVDNKFPQNIREASYKNPIIPRAMMFHINMAAKAAIVPVIVDYDDNGQELFQVVKDPKIKSFLGSTGWKRYMRESASDLFWFQNVFPDIIISKDRKTVAQISPNEAMFCRWGTQNDRGICDELLHNANWPNASKTDKYTTVLPTLDPYAYDIAEAVREQSDTFKFAYPASYPSPGALFYQVAYWDGIRQSQYLDFLARIPLVKNMIMKNKIKPVYHVQIPMIHWERWFGSDWRDADPEKKKQLKEDYLKTLESLLTQDENAGSAWLTEFGLSQHDNKIGDKWEITPIEDKTADGTHNQDNIDGTVQLLSALALDGALIGYSSKESGTRNGGSDKMQSLQIYVETMEPFKDILLEPLRFKAEYDGWTKKYPGLEFRAMYPRIDKLNSKGQTQTPNTNAA